MMRYIFIALWAALQICFILSFLTSFLEVKHRKDDVLWVVLAAWLLTTIYGVFESQGIYGYFMYFLMSVMILLGVHGEHGPKGMCLLTFAFVISFLSDMAVLSLVADISGLSYYIAVTCGKVLPVVLTLGFRRLFSAAMNDGMPDQDMLLLRQHMEMQQENMNALEQNYRMQRICHCCVLRSFSPKDSEALTSACCRVSIFCF